VTVPPLDRTVREDLLRRYAEPHRRYHDLRHLREVLDAVDRLAGHADDIDAVRLAGWFHDAVYDPRAGDNEERSAALAHAMLGTPLAEEVARLVRLTAHHVVAPGDGNGAALCDADLAILGASPERYDQYAADVRAEYAHLSDGTFRSGRAAVLTRLLDRERLYTTATAYDLWERRARANVQRELSGLGDAASRQR
jgi:predicted metal-dependent HD superfamily phosphohydrolase